MNTTPKRRIYTPADVRQLIGEKRSRQTRIVHHPRYPQNPVKNQRFEEHIDALSFYVFKLKGVTLRSLDLIPSVPPVKIDNYKSFFVLSYNVLCQTTFEKHKHLYGHLLHLKYGWQDRWNILSNELANLQSDIYCLQGVQKQRAVACYKVLFDKKGMNVFFTGRGQTKGDGCAIYWNPKKFEAIEKISINLDYKVENLDRSNVAQLICFKHIPTEKELIVVNSHLLYDPDRGDIKVYQLAVIIAHIQKARTKNQSIIFCGDLNIYPNSPIYKLIMEGKLNCRETYCVPKSMSGQQHMFNQYAMQNFKIPKETKITNNCIILEDYCNARASATLTHSICFESVYSHYTHSKEKEVTAFGFLYNFNSDYIFYSVEKKEIVQENVTKVVEGGLFLHRRLSLPDAKTMEQFSGPLPYFASGYVQRDNIADTKKWINKSANK
uniref:Endonuclease/exonuclease/phosphatase domain-containing protein n=1 Tax=Panagrolaimus sp. ES5 TaxID=591445 RepID=A0AC34FGN8_9BILA